jgi:uncharacterized protein
VEFVTLVEFVLDEYLLEWDGIHGIGHWARVLENGLRLAEFTGANRDVVTLFAVFHDARRFNDGHDPDHGLRGANLAATLRGKLFDLNDEDFALLQHACTWHTEGRTEGELSVQCCWDADRLDLGRVGIEPEPCCLCTDHAKSKPMRRWADGRARMEYIPELIRPLWDRCHAQRQL